MKLIKYMGVALAIAAFASCSNEDELSFSSWENDPSAVHIQATVGHSLLARTNPGAIDKDSPTQFVENDVISVTAGSQSTEYILKGKTWTPEGGNYLKWGKAENMDFEAYYPATEGTSMTQFTIPADQSSPEKIAKADYMTFNGNISRAAEIKLTFQRQTARIMVKLKFSSEFAAIPPSVTELKIKGYSQITKSSSSNLTNFTACEVKNAEMPTYAALVAPNTQASDKTFFISLKVDGTKFSVQGLPAVEAGNSYTYNLKVGRKGIGVESISVVNWNTKDLEIDNEALSPSDVVLNMNEHSITTTRPGTITYGLISAVAGDSKHLKVSGQINGKDFKAIREAAGCTYNCEDNAAAIVTDLDLKGAVIMASEDFYCNYSNKGNQKIEKNNQIGNYMFAYSKLEKIVLPSTVTHIGNGALISCWNLTTCTIQNGVKTIGEYAFYSNHKINNVHLPASVTTLGISCFSDCQKLETITMDKNIQITTIPRSCFNDTYLTDFTFPSKVSTIDSYAFANTALGGTTFVIPAHITTIKSNIFEYSHINGIIIEGPQNDRVFNDDAFLDATFSENVNYLKLDKSWKSFVTNQSMVDGKLQGDFKGIHFLEIVFTDNGNPVPTPDQP